ncbi:MAG: hypothetical protein F6K39_19695, partial [Okeania sp. SIO3B3]|nr:hypothetical protein [Okeania sp. SIO3B3]
MVTAKEVTNWYLYGQKTTPTNLVNDDLIRPASAKPTVQIEAAPLMETGAGRFAIGSQFELVQRFFYEEGDEDLYTFPKLEEPITELPLDWEEFSKPG